VGPFRGGNQEISADQNKTHPRANEKKTPRSKRKKMNLHSTKEKERDTTGKGIQKKLNGMTVVRDGFTNEPSQTNMQHPPQIGKALSLMPLSLIFGVKAGAQ